MYMGRPGERPPKPSRITEMVTSISYSLRMPPITSARPSSDVISTSARSRDAASRRDLPQ